MEEAARENRKTRRRIGPAPLLLKNENAAVSGLLLWRTRANSIV